MAKFAFLLFFVGATLAESGVVIRKAKVDNPSTRSASAIDDYRKSSKKLEGTLDFARNTVKAAPGSRTVQFQKVLKAQGEATVAAEAAKEKSEQMMDDVAVDGDLPTKEPPQVDDDLQSQADDLATHMGSGALGCDCAAQLYGDDRVTLIQKAGCNCHKNQRKVHRRHALAQNAAAVEKVEPMSDFDLSCYETSDKGKGYRGLQTSTNSGRACQNWVKQKPHTIDITPSTENGLGNHNYCRNPDQSEDKPWCYTMDSSSDHAKETCQVPECPGMARDFHDEASTIATKVASHDCECAAQLYGATTTSRDTSVSMLQKKTGKIVDGKCHCN